MSELQAPLRSESSNPAAEMIPPKTAGNLVGWADRSSNAGWTWRNATGGKRSTPLDREGNFNVPCSRPFRIGRGISAGRPQELSRPRTSTSEFPEGRSFFRQIPSEHIPRSQTSHQEARVHRCLLLPTSPLLHRLRIPGTLSLSREHRRHNWDKFLEPLCGAGF